MTNKCDGCINANYVPSAKNEIGREVQTRIGAGAFKALSEHQYRTYCESCVAMTALVAEDALLQKEVRPERRLYPTLKIEPPKPQLPTPAELYGAALGLFGKFLGLQK